MKMMKVISVVLAMAMVVLTGCSTMNGNTSPVWVKTTPGGATVKINGQTQTSPAWFEVHRAPFTASATKQGFNPASEQVGTHMSELAKVDIFVGLFLFWPNLFGLLTPGARDHNKSEINLNLTPNAQQYADPMGQQSLNTMDNIRRAQYKMKQALEIQAAREVEYQRWLESQGQGL